MMLLMGINMSFTKNPTNPITTNPIAVRTATFVNSTKPNQTKQIQTYNTTDLSVKHTDLRNTQIDPADQTLKNIQISHMHHNYLKRHEF